MPKETASITLILPIQMHRQFKAKAALEGRKQSEVLKLFIEAYLNGMELKQLEKFIKEQKKKQQKELKETLKKIEKNTRK